jgi:NADH-quinone oxidoreductase subunit C
LDAADLHRKIAEKFGENIVSELLPEHCDPTIEVEHGSIREVAGFLRDDPELAFDFLRIITGVDDGKSLICVYHLYSIQHKHTLVVKCPLSYDFPELDSVEEVWPAADWHERETFDMMGIIFNGHHNLRRILCPEDWEGHPLRKDYTPPEHYHGISNE